MFMIIKYCVILHAVHLALGAVAACTSLQTINAITPSDTYHKIADVAYGNDPRQKLDAYWRITKPLSSGTPGCSPAPTTE
jgi:hypothetical protein